MPFSAAISINVTTYALTWDTWHPSVGQDPLGLYIDTDTKSNNQLLALVSFVFRDKILKQIHTIKC